MTKRYSSLGLLLLLGFLTLLLIPGPVQAQNLSASISGTVTDPSGATVPNAEMTLKSVSTGTETKAKSSPEGLFSILNLSQGTYDLMVSAQGFRDYIRRGISVNLNERIRLDVKLELGEAKQVVEVMADASPLNFDTGEVKGTISPQTLEELPLIVGGITRSAVAFARLLPGVTSASGDDRRNFETRINGGINEGDEAILDGITIVDGALSQNGIELATTGIPFSPEAIAEISILTSNYDPQYGTTSSAVTTAVTKSGTNEFHGSLYEFHRNTVLNARQFGVPKRPRDLENEFGGTIGGPMKIPKIFWTPTKKTYFFVNRTQFYLRGGVSSPILSIPSLKERQGDFTDWVDSTGKLIPVYDPDTTRANPAYDPNQPVGPSNLPFLRNQFMGCDGKTPNVICSSDPRLQNSLAQGWFKYLPTPTFPGPLNNYVVPIPRTTTVIADSTVMDIKVDHYWKDKDRFSAVVHYFGSGYDKNTNLPREIDGSDHRAPNYDFYDRGSWDHTFNPTLLNSFNIGYNDIYSFGVCEDKDQAGAVPKISGVLSNEFPSVIGFQDFVGYGCNGVFGTVRPAWVANDLVTWVKGKHNFKFGGEFRALEHNITGRGNQSGTFGFSHLTTGLRGITSGNSIASFILGAVDSATMSYPTVDSQYARQKVYAFHVGDTWKMTPKLSLNLGLRYDISTPTREKYDNLSFLDPNGANPGAGGRPGRLVFAGTKWGSASFGKSYPEQIDYKAFAPRVGFAYQVTPNTVVRAGYGVFFLTLSYPNWASGISPGTDGFNQNIAFGSTGNGGIEPAFLLQEGFPQNFTKPPFIDPTIRNGKSIGLYRPFDGGRPTYAQQWNLTIERQFTKDLYMTGAYVANKGTRILSTVAPLNALNPSLLSLGQSLYDEFQPGDTSLHGVPIPYTGWVEQMTSCLPTVAQALRPYPQYCNSLQGETENAGNSTYHSFQVKVEKRFGEGFWLLSSYTLSKNISNNNDIQSFANNWGGISGVISPFERQRNKSLDLADVPQTWSLALVYQLPVGRGKRFLNQGGVVDKILGGWQISSVSRVQSGIPNYFRSGTCNVPSQFSVGCIPSILPGKDPFAQDKGNFDPNKPLFNKDAFEPESSFNFYYGKGGRTENVRGFGYHGHDLGILKNIAINERMYFQVRGELVNVWNWHTFTGGATWGGGLPFDTNLSSPNFGRWTGQVSSPRNVQLVAKFIF